MLFCPVVVRQRVYSCSICFIFCCLILNTISSSSDAQNFIFEFVFWPDFPNNSHNGFKHLCTKDVSKKEKPFFPLTSKNRHSTFCLSYICLRFQFLYANSKCSPMLPETVHIFDFLFFMNCLCSEYANQMNWLCGSVMCHKRIAILLRMSTCLAGCLPACVLAFFRHRLALYKYIHSISIWFLYAIFKLIFFLVVASSVLSHSDLHRNEMIFLFDLASENGFLKILNSNYH